MEEDQFEIEINDFCEFCYVEKRNWVYLEEDTASDMFVFSWCLKLEKYHHTIMLIGIIYERLVLNRNTDNSVGRGGKEKYMCTNVGRLDKEVQACGSSLVIAFIFSVK